MADFSENPADNISVDALVKKLEGVTDELLASRRAGDAAQAKAAQQAEAAERRRQREAQKAKSAPRTTPSPVGRVDPTLAEADKVRRAAAATEKHEARISDHLERQNRTLQAASRVRSAAMFGATEEQVRRAAESLPSRHAAIPTSPYAPGTITAADRVRAANAEELAARAQAEAARAEARRLQSEEVRRSATGRRQPRTGRVGGGLRDRLEATGQDPSGLVAQNQAIDGMARSQAGAQKETAAKKELTAVTRSATLANTDFARSQAYATQEAHLASPVYTRNGALTTEFISAAAKGQVTIKELGRQVALTVGKFAGWTLAAAATYGMVRAVGVLGKGAIDGLDAVNKLSRVVNDLDSNKAQQQLREAATKFNLPLDEVGEAAYGSAKVFKDQEDIFKGTEAALFAVKVGELDAGTATQALTAIINGLGVGADALGPIFDKINNLTNSFGGNVGQLTVGLSKSAGAFVNAGGSVEYLLSLLQTGARVTSYTAQEIGTALSRTSERLQQPARRVKVSQLLGISEDDAGDIELVFEKIFERVREGADTQEIANIASTVSTPLLATRLIPIIKRESLFRQIQGGTTEEASAGSAERELARVKESASEQIKAAGVALGNLGSALATSGALEPLLAVAKTLVLAIRGATELVEVFAGLPGPIKTAAAFMAQFAAAAALARRFDVGGTIGRAFPDAEGNARLGLPFSRNPAKLERANTLQALDAQRAFLQQRRERAAIEAAAVAFEGQSSERRIDKLLGGRPVEALDEKELKEYNRHLNRANRSAEQAADLAETAEEARLQDVDTQKRRNDYQRRIKRGVAPQDAAVGAGLIGYRGDAQDRVSTTAPVPIIATRRDSGLLVVEQGLAKKEKALDEAKRHANQSAKQGLRTGLAAGAAARVFNTGATVLKGAGGGIRAAGRGLAAFGLGLAGLFGPIEAALLSAFLIYTTIKKGQEQLQSAQDLLAANADPEAIRKAADKELGDKSLLDKLQRAAADSLLGKGLGLLGVDVRAPDDVADDAARRAKVSADVLQRAQDKGVALTQTQIRKNLKERLDAAKTGAEKDAAVAEARAALDRSYLVMFGAGKAGKAAIALTKDQIRQAANAIEDGQRSLQERLNALQGAQEITDFNLITTNQLAVGGLTKGTARKLAGTATQAREQAANETDEKAKAELLAKATEIEQQLFDEADKRLQQLLNAARTPREAGIATRSFLRRASGVVDEQQSRYGFLRGELGKDRREKERLEAANRKDEARVAALRKRQPSALGTPGGPLGAPIAPGFADPDLAEAAKIQAEIDKRTARIGKLGADIGKEKKAAEDLRKSLGLSKRAFRDLRRKLEEAQFDLEQESFDAGTELLQSQSADPVANARTLADRLRQKVAAIKEQLALGNKKAIDVTRAISAYNESLKQVAEGELAQSESRRQLATSQFNLSNPSPDASAQRAVSDAQAALADVRSKGSRVDPTKLLDAQRAVNEALRARADQVRETAQELIKAQAEYDKSRTDDPVKQAQIDATAAKKLEAFARTPVEKLTAKAATRNAQKALIQQRIDSRVDDIDFNLEMERITRDEAIRQLRALTKTAGITKQARRDILRKIKGLEEGDDGNLDLALGNIKLPTVYEVRRAIDEAGAAAKSAPALSRMDVIGQRTTNNGGNTVNFNITGPQDYDEMGRILETHIKGTGKSLARAGMFR